VRHGEVEGNSGERRTFAGWNDLALTPRGEHNSRAPPNAWSAKTCAPFMHPICSAPPHAEMIAEPHELPVQTDAALREVHYGAWAGWAKPSCYPTGVSCGNSA
jgi:broad specificity phosphatase PhoE